MVRQEKSESYLSEVQQNIMYKRMRAERRQEARRRKKKKKWESGKTEEMETHYTARIGRAVVPYYSLQLSNGRSTASILSH